MSDKKTCVDQRPSTVLRIIIVGLSASLLMSAKTQGQKKWPQFHGPHRDNISHEMDLSKIWPKEGPPLIWTTDGLGHGFSSVSVADGMLYTLSIDRVMGLVRPPSTSLS